jgi:hypothetical protein
MVPMMRSLPLKEVVQSDFVPEVTLSPTHQACLEVKSDLRCQRPRCDVVGAAER